MGKSFTPKYRVEVDGKQFAAWSNKYAGKPSDKALADYIVKYIKSQEIGGVNDHLSKATGKIHFPNHARIVRQSDNVAVATYLAPKFLSV